MGHDFKHFYGSDAFFLSDHVSFIVSVYQNGSFPKLDSLFLS